MITLDAALRQAARNLAIPFRDGIEPLAFIPYAEELKIKRAGFEMFLEELKLKHVQVLPMVPAPQPRGYRTTSRRRLWFERTKPFLVHGDGSGIGTTSPLEPETHAAIFATAQVLIDGMHSSITELVNHIVIRGTYEEHVLIINVREVNAKIIRATRQFANKIAEAHPIVKHAWIYVDPRGSRFYLEVERPSNGIESKKIFGSAAWSQTVDAIDYQVGVFSFTQVNLAMLPEFLKTVKNLVEARKTDTLYDLFCGYGFFGAALAGDVASVVALDADTATVDNARYNIRRAGGVVYATAVTLEAKKLREVVTKTIRHLGDNRDLTKKHAMVAVIDPPRSGTAPGLITEITALQPERVVEIFCGPDEIQRSLREWRKGGYVPTKIQALDLFPGTLGLEVCVVLEKDPTITPDFSAPEASSLPTRRPAPKKTPVRTSGRPRR